MNILMSILEICGVNSFIHKYPIEIAVSLLLHPRESEQFSPITPQNNGINITYNIILSA